MKIDKKLIFLGIFLVVILLVIGSASATYRRSDSRFTGVSSSGAFLNTFTQVPEEDCESGQDFLVQIAPFGCTPAVVRSDLLEEQDVPVFCQLAATKLNPLIDIKAIKNIDFIGKYPEGVREIAFHPAQGALGIQNYLNSPVLNNIGYAVIVLEKNANASAMQDFIQGNMTAKIWYDIENAYGIGRVNFYLPELTDEEWNEEYKRFGFWNGKGYVRAESIRDNDQATIGVYNGIDKIAEVNLEKGETSRKVNLPGFDCLAGLQIKLEKLDAPDTRARLNVNGEIYEVAEGESFLNSKCIVTSIKKWGLLEEVKGHCFDFQNDKQSFTLTLSPKIKLLICDKNKENCKEGIYEVGDQLSAVNDQAGRFFYLGYLGEDSKGEAFTIIVNSPENTKERFKNTAVYSLLPEVVKVMNFESGNWALDFFQILIKGVYGAVGFGANIIVTGDIPAGIVYEESSRYADTDFFEGITASLGQGLGWLLGDITGITDMFLEKDQIKFLGFADSENIKLSDQTKSYYDNSLNDYNTVLDSYSNTVYPRDEDQTKGELAALEKIRLAHSLSQKKDVLEFCDFFKENFPNAKDIKELDNYCSNPVFLSSSSLNSIILDVDGQTKEIILNNIFEPSYEDFGALVSISSGKGPGDAAEVEMKYSVIDKKTNKEYSMDSFKMGVGSVKKIFIGNKEYDLQVKEIQNNQATFYFKNAQIEQFILKSGENKAIFPINGEDSGFKLELLSVKQETYEPPVNLPEQKLTKNGMVPLLAGDSITLLEVHEDYITIGVNVDTSFGQSIMSFSDFNFQKRNIRLGESITGLGKYGYKITVNDIKLKKNAKIEVIPKIDNEYTETNFNYKIGIEQRGIRLAPDEIKEKLDRLNKSIADWEDKYNKLGNIVKGMKTACLGTGAFLTVKNFFANKDGKSIARQDVMRGSGGWYEVCDNLVRQGEYRDVEKCLSANSNAIDKDVNKVYEAMKTQNENIKKIQEDYQKKNIFGEKIIQTQEFSQAYLSDAKSRIKSNLQNRYPSGIISYQNKEVSIDEFINSLSVETMPIDEIRELELNSGLTGSDQLNAMMDQRIKVQVKDIYETNEDLNIANAYADSLGLNSIDVNVIINKNSEAYNYKGKTYKDIQSKVTLQGVSPNTPVAAITTSDGKNYIATLNQNGNKYSVATLYNFDGSVAEQTLNVYFVGYTNEDYNNEYVSSLGKSIPIARFYETEPYQNYPALVPFDLKYGWYVSIKQNLPILGGIQSYDESGRANSFYLCNVGENGREENLGGDDICRSFVNGQYYDQFPGVQDRDTKELIDAAIDAIGDAQRAKQKDPKTRKILIDTSRGKFWVEVGDPAADVPDLQCQDFMSPSDCKILFNVCDPVICPSSRCDLGGAYPVRDVIQSGIFGSIALCLPNFPEVYVPVCLSGVHAGMDGWLSVQKSYRDCLQHNLETGETVGICDEIHSIYACEFFWRQGVPLARLAIPKILGILSGQSSKGGGEYLGVASAWTNAEQSINYFTQYYGENSFKAFQARSVDEAGGEVCKSFISGVYPTSGTVLDSMTDPDSPYQFTARFDEIPFTTATNPPISQYKVFYHIYAGRDQGAYYKVYLRASPETSFYQDTSAPRYVSSGYIAKGEYKTETADFTAPAGYKELCVMVNNQLECGFAQVSSDFAINYIKDKYMEEQASEENIKTEKDCIAGTSSFYAFINPNIQEGVDEALNPSIYDRGLIRTCATANPGKGTDINYDNPDEARWRPVGYCDDPNMVCWLDTNSVKDVIDNLDIEEKVLDEKADTYLEVLKTSGKYVYTDPDFDAELGKLPKSPGDRIIKLGGLLEKVFWPTYKGHIYYLRGQQYGFLSYFGYMGEVMKLAEDQTTPFEIQVLSSDVYELISKGFVTGLKAGDSLKFTLNGKIHTLTVKSIDIQNGKVVFVLESDPIEFELEIGKKEEFYIDGEGFDGVYIELNNIENGEAKVNFGLLKSKTAREYENVGIGFISPSFRYHEGGKADTYFKYKDNKWSWSFNEDRDWIDVKEDTKDKDLSDESQRFIWSLRGETYEGGFRKLIERAIKQDDSITTKNIEFTEDEIIKLNRDYADDVEFKYLEEGEKGWQYKIKDSGWLSSYPSAYSDDEIERIMNSLEGKSFEEGVKELFDYDVPFVINVEGFTCRDIKEGSYLSIAYADCIGEEGINSLLIARKSPMQGLGKDFINFANQYGIDPIIALAFFTHESALGTSNIATNAKNPGNIKFYSGCPTGKYFTDSLGRNWCKYDSWQQGVEDWFALISGKSYAGIDLDTVEEIIPKYAPASENDVEAYIKFVRDFVKRNRKVETFTYEEGNINFIVSSANIKYKSLQLRDSNVQLISFLNCIDANYKSKADHITINSLTDDHLYRPEDRCELNDYDRPPCQHRDNSCHYADAVNNNWYPKSLAADISSRGIDIEELQNAFNVCNNNMNLNADYIPELNTNHVHVSIYDCDGNAPQGYADKDIYEEDLYVAKPENIDYEDLDLDYESPVFEFDDARLFTKDMYYRYFEGSWWWSFNKQGEWQPALYNELSYGETDTEGQENYYSYTEGLGELVKRTKRNEGGQLWWDVKLNIYGAYSLDKKITLRDDGIFIIFREDYEFGDLYIKEVDGGWEWSDEEDGGRNWNSDVSLKGKERIGEDYVDLVLKLMNENIAYPEGAALICEYEEKPFSVEFVSPMNGDFIFGNTEIFWETSGYKKGQAFSSLFIKKKGDDLSMTKVLDESSGNSYTWDTSYAEYGATYILIVMSKNKEGNYILDIESDSMELTIGELREKDYDETILVNEGGEINFYANTYSCAGEIPTSYEQGENKVEFLDFGLPEGVTCNVNQAKIPILAESETDTIFVIKAYVDFYQDALDANWIDKSLFQAYTPSGYINLGKIDLEKGRFISTNDNSEEVFQSIGLTSQEVFTLFKEYKEIEKYSGYLYDLVLWSRDHTINNGYEKKSCECGIDEECQKLSFWIDKYSKQYKVDPVLVLSAIIQESDCIFDKESSSGAYGLMQVTTLGFNEHCVGLSGLNSFEDIKGINNKDKNIQCGVDILLDKYREFRKGVEKSWSYKNSEAFRKIVDACFVDYPHYKDYKDYKAGLRGYNGWGCVEPQADLVYPEKIYGINSVLKSKIPS